MRFSCLMLSCISLAFVTSSASQAQTPIFGDFGAPAWDRMYKVIEKRFGATAATDAVLVMPVATNAAWDDPSQTIRLMEMYQWGEYMPSKAWNYARNSGKRVSTGYKFFLTSALLQQIASSGTATADLKAALTNATQEVDFTRNDYNQTQDTADAAYLAYVKSSPGHKKTKAEYFKDQGWDKQIDTKHKKLVDALATFDLLSANIADPDIQMLKDAFIRFDNPKQQIRLPPTREVLNNSDLWQTAYVSLVGNDLQKFLSETKTDDQDVQESSSTSETFEKVWHASVSVSFLGLFRAGGASAEQIQRETHIKNNATRLYVSFDNLDIFPIVRGEWFDQNVIDRFAPKLKPDVLKSIFGPNGQLEEIPQSLLIGRGMAFDVYADSQSLDYLYDHFEAGADAGIFIGWWRIGGEGGYSSTHEQTKIYKYQDHIRVVDLSGRAKVIAVLAKQYDLSKIAQFAVVSSLAGSLSASNVEASAKKIEASWSPSKVLAPYLVNIRPELLSDMGASR